MTTWAQQLHEDNLSVKTSASYGDRGDGVNDWFTWVRLAASSDASIGAITDAAVAAGANGTVIALLKGLQVSQGSLADTSALTGNGSMIALLKAIRDEGYAPYHSAQTPVTATSGNVANASAAATIAAVASKTNYLTGFDITGVGATSASVVTVTVAGLLGGTLSYVLVAPVGALAPLPVASYRFDPPLPASAANIGIVVTVPALGTGNTNVIATAYGFRQ